MEKIYQYQLGRVYRLMEIVNAQDPDPLMGNLNFEDVLIFTCQSIWHLKDWILNDPEFGAKDPEQLKADIHSEKSLLVCADLANGSKHLKLRGPKTGFDFAEPTGIHLNQNKGINQKFYYIVSSDHSDPYFGKEIRELLADCRKSWERIIDKHYLSRLGVSRVLARQMRREETEYFSRRWIP